MVSAWIQSRRRRRASVCLAWRSACASSAVASSSNRSRAAARASKSHFPSKLRSLMLKVLIADDHGIVRAGLRLLLERAGEVQVVGEATNGRELVRMVSELSPDVAIVDIGMPLLNGID